MSACGSGISSVGGGGGGGNDSYTTEATGIFEGAALSINGVDNTQFDIAAGTGQIVDFSTIPVPAPTQVVIAAQTGIAVVNIAAQTQTYVLVDSVGAVSQQVGYPTASQLRDFIFLGKLNHANLTNLSSVVNEPNLAVGVTSGLEDHATAIGMINVNPIVVSGRNLVDLTFAIATAAGGAGDLWLYGSNYAVDKTDPHRTPFAPYDTSVSPFPYILSDGSFALGPPVTNTLDPGFYEDTSVAPPVRTALLPITRWTNQRIYATVTGSVVAMYGQTTYANISDALRGIASEIHLRPNILLGGESILLATITVEGNAANLTAAVIQQASKFGEAAGSGGGGGGASISINTGNTLWVDAVFGNDGTALPDRQDLPYLTVGAALAAVVSGDTIMIRPGAYSEEGLTLPQGVSIEGQGGWQVTEIGFHAAVSDIIQVADQSSIEGIAFLIPSTAGLAGVRYTGVTDPTFSIYNCNFYGDRGVGAGAGDGLVKNGAGKIIGAEIRGDRAGMNALLRVDRGVIALESIHVPPDPAGGTINVVALCERAVPGATPPAPANSGRFQLVDINAGNPNVVDVVRMDGGSSVIFGINTFSVQNALHITADNIKLEVLGGKMSQQFFAVIVDAGLTGGDSVVRITANHQPIYDYPPAVAATADFGLTFFQERFITAYSEQRAFGTDLALGFPERGSALYAGKGSPYGLGMVALTTDSSATNVSDGGGFVDVTVGAQSLPGFLTSATVTFQGGAAGHSILWCSARQDATLDELKHWGLRIVQTTASVGGSYIFEISTPGGAGQEWTEIGVMAVSEVEQYRYANNVFLRGTPAAPTTEILRWGIDEDTVWENRLINGQNGYWCRVRITSLVGTLPVFETMWLTDSFLESNRTGQRTASGLARWRGSIQASGNIWSETSLGGSSYTVGTGAVTWSHDLDNSVLSATNDELFYQFNIPRGLDTSYPLKLRVYYMNLSGVAGTNTLVLDLIPLQSTNVLIADPAGSVVPILRTLAATTTLTAIPGSQVSVLCTDSGTQLQSSFFESFDISDFYEDDVVAIRIQVASASPDVTVWGLGIEGVFWSDGRGLI